MAFEKLLRLFGRAKAGTATHGSDSSIGADVPIRSATEDLLSRTILARRIAEIVSARATGEGRVFAIRGSWGYGKSSLKNLVIEELNKRKPSTDYLEFNPWQWGDADTIARALFGQIASRLGGMHSPDAMKRANALRQYGSILVGSSSILKKFGEANGLSSWLGSVGLVFAGAGIVVPSLPIKIIAAITLIVAGLLIICGKILNWLGRDVSTEPLNHVRRDLEARLARLDRPLVVFVDDIDRLEAEQIRLLFRQIKVNANLPNILFVLLFQPSIVETALAPVAGTEGRQYLEKIVQAHFDLPPVAPERLFEIFGNQLSEIVGDLAVEANGFEHRRWGNVAIGGIRPFIRNLRDVRRVLTSIQIHLPLHRGTRVFEVNIIDFLALEVLRVFEPEFYAAIASDKTLFLQSHRFDGDGREKRDKPELERIWKLTSEERRAPCKDLLVELFPQINWAFGGSHYSGSEWTRTWLNEKRVCTTRSFDRYFQLQLPDGAISESDFVDLLEAAEDSQKLNQAIAVLRERGLLSALATRFDESVNQLPLEHIERLFPAIFELGEELSCSSGADGPFNTPFISAWRAASWYLKRVATAAERGQIMLDAMVSSQTLAVPETLISLDISAREKSNSRHDPLFDDKVLESLKQAWLAILRKCAQSDPGLFAHYRLVGYLYRWRDFTGSFDEPRAWVGQIAANPSRFSKLIQRFLQVGSSTSVGDHVSTRTESFRQQTISDFFDLAVLSKQLSTINRSSIPPEEDRIISILENHLATWNRGEVVEED